MRYEDYIANLTQLAVDVVNTGSAQGLTGMSRELFEEHQVTPPSDDDLRELLPLLESALIAVASGDNLLKINELLLRYPPDVHLSNHDGLGAAQHAPCPRR